jgi:uncharacterized protein with PIN domain
MRSRRRGRRRRHGRRRRGAGPAAARPGPPAVAAESARAAPSSARGPLPLDASAAVAFASATGRILLTRDRKVVSRRDPAVAAWIPSADTGAQFTDVTTRFGITVRPEDLMSRCARCNGLGYERIVAADVAAALSAAPGRWDVPAKILRKIDEFWRCPACDKLYWEGGKFNDTRERFWASWRGGEEEGEA